MLRKKAISSQKEAATFQQIRVKNLMPARLAGKKKGEPFPRGK
jgi:hypothetical protein